MKKRQLQQFLDEYWRILMNSQLTDKSIEDYYYFAEVFVRWINGEFEPGRRLRNDGSN